MNEEAKRLKNEYQKQWRASNKERVQQYNRDYWQRQAEKTQKEDTTDERATD